MSVQNSNILGTQKIGRLLFKLALPAIIAQLVNLLYNIVDRIFIGQMIGPLALTGVGVSVSIIILVSAFSSLVGMGGAPKAAICMGKGDNEKAEHILSNCFTLICILGVVLTIFFRLTGKDLLLMFGASQETIGFATKYLNIYILGTFFVMVSIGLNAFISTQGHAIFSMVTVLIGAVINIVLDFVFMYILHMGVEGAALATVISQGVSAIWVLKFLFGKRSSIKIRKKYMKLNKGIVLSILALGISPFIMQSTESLLTVSFNTSLQKYGGDVAVGAMTILASVMQILNLPLMGLTQGAQPIISYNYGARNAKRVKEGFRLLLISALTYSTLFWLFTMFFPQILVVPFADDKSLVSTAAWALRIYLAVGFVMGAQLACQQTFIAIGQAKSSLFLALLRKVILLIPLIYIIPLFFKDKVMGVFIAEPVADFIAVTVTVSMFTYQFKRILKDLKQTPA